MLAALSRVDGRRRAGGGLAAGAARTRPPRAGRLERGDSGRDLGGRKPVREKTGGDSVGLTKVGKGSKLMMLIDGQGLPMAANLHAANHAEVHLIQPLLDEHQLDERQLDEHQLEEHSPRLIYDRAADSNKLRDELAADRILLITPHRKSCRNIHPAHDCRVLKRYKNPWKVERTIAASSPAKTTPPTTSSRSSSAPASTVCCNDFAPDETASTKTRRTHQIRPCVFSHRCEDCRPDSNAT